MRVNDAETLVVDEMIRDDGKRKSGRGKCFSQSPTGAAGYLQRSPRQEESCKLSPTHACASLQSNDGAYPSNAAK